MLGELLAAASRGPDESHLAVKRMLKAVWNLTAEATLSDLASRLVREGRPQVIEGHEVPRDAFSKGIQ